MVVSAQRNHGPGLPSESARPTPVDRRASLARRAHRRSRRPGAGPLCPEHRSLTSRSVPQTGARTLGEFVPVTTSLDQPAADERVASADAWTS